MRVPRRRNQRRDGAAPDGIRHAVPLEGAGERLHVGRRRRHRIVAGQALVWLPHPAVQQGVPDRRIPHSEHIAFQLEDLRHGHVDDMRAAGSEAPEPDETRLGMDPGGWAVRRVGRRRRHRVRSGSRPRRGRHYSPRRQNPPGSSGGHGRRVDARVAGPAGKLPASLPLFS